MNITTLWSAVCEQLDPFAASLAALHGPELEHHHVAVAGPVRVCGGCDMGTYAESRADWPCTTAELILRHLGYAEDGSQIADLAPRD